MDEEALARLAADCPAGPEELRRQVGLLRRPGAGPLYTSALPAVGAMTGLEEVRGVSLELWSDDGSEEFEQVYQRLEKDGPFEAEGGRLG